MQIYFEYKIVALNYHMGVNINRRRKRKDNNHRPFCKYHLNNNGQEIFIPRLNRDKYF